MKDVHEQHELEALKSWWKANGMALVTGGLIAVSAVFGWQSWQSYQRANAEAASHLYEQLREPSAQQNFANVSRDARSLLVTYPDSTYAVGAAFMLAKHYTEASDWVEAEANLRWVLAHSDEAHWRAIAHLRLARILMAQDKHSEALQHLESHYQTLPVAFQGMADYLKGMILMVKGEAVPAQAAFRKAQANKEVALSVRSLSQLWVEDLGQAE